MERREFSKKLVSTVLSYSLMNSLVTSNAITKKVNPITNNWANQLNEYCLDLKKETITIEEWRILIEQLYQKIELKEILEFINFDNLTKGFSFPDLGVNTKMVKFPKLEGLPPKTVFIKKIFGMKKERAIIPHGHSNMVSAHLIIKGEMHLRHYDKIRIEDDRMIIKPTIDKMIKTGESSSISDDRDNVHWFIANTDTAFTFDVIMLNLNEKEDDIHNIDIYEKENLRNGNLSVPILDVETALKKYGKETHH